MRNFLSGFAVLNMINFSGILDSGLPHAPKHDQKMSLLICSFVSSNDWRYKLKQSKGDNFTQVLLQHMQHHCIVLIAIVHIYCSLIHTKGKLSAKLGCNSMSSQKAFFSICIYYFPNFIISSYPPTPHPPQKKVHILAALHTIYRFPVQAQWIWLWEWCVPWTPSFASWKIMLFANSCSGLVGCPALGHSACHFATANKGSSEQQQEDTSHHGL